MRTQRHTGPHHICCYIGPVHVPKGVYDVWRAVLDSEASRRPWLRVNASGWWARVLIAGGARRRDGKDDA